MISRRAAVLAGASALALRAQSSVVPRWGIVEVAGRGPDDDQSFLRKMTAQFRRGSRTMEVAGFYDGGGVYKVRFMPDEEGEWTCTFNGAASRFVCGPPSAGNHGPVSVRDTYRFVYADGTPYYPFGTTCYAWAHQGDRLEEQTLATLRTAPFNKIRMCVFPKWYAYNHVEPQFYPFPRAGGTNDLSRFNPEYFQHFERRVAQLGALGIEADLILFHPYDNWGYANLPTEVNHRYLRYVIARLGAYRNVWWSLANEWDLVKTKVLADWDGFFRVVEESDPYHRMRSIHHSRVMYDHAKPVVTHASIQGDDFDKIAQWREAFRKPLIFDECKYEGNIPRRWGDISAREMVHRFWLGTTLGAWVGHGETYLDANEVLWWSKGGVLHGESAPRIAFLRRIIESGPPAGMSPLPGAYYPCIARPGEDYLFYLDYHRPAEYTFDLAPGARYRAELIDTWEMKTVRVDGVFTEKAAMKLPGEPYWAVRYRKA